MAPDSPSARRFPRWILPLSLILGAWLLFLTRPQLAPRADFGQTQSASCLSNLSAISRAYAQYARDFDGKIPLAVDPEDRFNSQIWQNTGDEDYQIYLKKAPFLHQVLRPYVASATVFRCPSDVGWPISRLQIDQFSGQNTGLLNVRPSSFAKYGTSYYSWTIYGFDQKTVADIPNPARHTVLFDGDLWHSGPNGNRAGELFLDGHAELLSKAGHDSFAPDRN